MFPNVMHYQENNLIIFFNLPFLKEVQIYFESLTFYVILVKKEILNNTQTNLNNK